MSDGIANKLSVSDRFLTLWVFFGHVSWGGGGVLHSGYGFLYPSLSDWDNQYPHRHRVIHALVQE